MRRACRQPHRGRLEISHTHRVCLLLFAELANDFTKLLSAPAERLGDIVEALRRDGLYDNTVVVFFSDHGMDLPRHKQFLYEVGIRVPLIIASPGIPEGEVRQDLVSGIDLGPTALALAGITIPPHMEGRNLVHDPQ